MAENSFVKKVDCVRQRVKGIEERSHYVSNILMVAALSLIVLFTLLSGVNVNVGSTYKGDNEDACVRQSFFQLVDATLNSSMTETAALEYTDIVADKLNSYGVLAPSTAVDIQGDDPFHSLDFTALIAEAKAKMGSDVNRINWIKYKYALSVVIANTTLDAHKSSWNGHVTVMIAGQAIFEALIRLAITLIALTMLVFAVISLIKRKKFMRARLCIVLLLVCFFASMILRFGFITPDALMTIVLVLIPLLAIAYALLSHALMENRDFSFTMFINNAVLVVGGALAFFFMTGPLFKVADNYGVSRSYGWNFLFDLLLGEGAYMAVPMSYFLQAFIMSALLMMNAIICAILIISVISRFLAANYQHNDKKSMLIGTAVYSFIIVLLIGISSANGSLRITSLDFVARVKVAMLVLQMLTLAGLVVFSYLFKPKAIKKEFSIRDAQAPATAAAAATPATAAAPSTPKEGD